MPKKSLKREKLKHLEKGRKKERGDFTMSLNLCKCDRKIKIKRERQRKII